MKVIERKYRLCVFYCSCCFLKNVQDAVSCENALENTTQDIGNSSGDSDEDDDDSVSKDEEYMFPTPDEIEKTNVPQVGKVFSTLDAAKRFLPFFIPNPLVRAYTLTNLLAASRVLNTFPT